MRKLGIMLVLASLVLPSLEAAEVNWTGTNSNNWNEAANWDCNCLPGPDDDVRIPIGGSVDLTDDVSAAVASLTVRGDLYIDEGSNLQIGSIENASATGLELILGSLQNLGQLTVYGSSGQSAIYVNTDVVFRNVGSVLVGEITCPSSACALVDVLEVQGELLNEGEIRMLGVYDMDAIRVQGAMINSGMLQIDYVRTGGTVFSLSRTASFNNEASGLLMIQGVEGENLTRVLANTQDSVSWVNSGEIHIEISGEEPIGLSFGGEGTSLFNAGTVAVNGGRIGMSLSQVDSFINSGELLLSGQQEKGIQLNGALGFQNSGSIVLQNGQVLEAISLSGVSPGPDLLNTGSIRVQSYMEQNNFCRGIKASVGAIRNEGFIGIEGPQDGRGVEIQEAAVPFDNASGGTLFLNYFDQGLQIAQPTTNYGTMILASGLGDAILDDNIVLTNLGTLAGGSDYGDGTLELGPAAVLSPGTDTTTARQTFGSDLVIGEGVTVDLDLAASMEQPDAYDQIRCSRSLQFHGVINVRLRPEFAVANASFDLLRASGSAGGLSGEPLVNLPEPPQGSNWRLEQTETKLVLYLDLINSTDDVLREDSKLLVYPNPAPVGTPICIQIKENLTPLYIYNAQGQLLQTIALNGQRPQLQTIDWPAGQYWLRTNTGSQLLILH